MTETDRERIEALIAAWRVSQREADRLFREADARGFDGCNAHAFLKERRIWTTCADALEALLSSSSLSGEMPQRERPLMACHYGEHQDCRSEDCACACHRAGCSASPDGQHHGTALRRDWCEWCSTEFVPAALSGETADPRTTDRYHDSGAPLGTEVYGFLEALDVDWSTFEVQALEAFIQGRIDAALRARRPLHREGPCCSRHDAHENDLDLSGGVAGREGGGADLDLV
jgi:hypothetical protein